MKKEHLLTALAVSSLVVGAGSTVLADDIVIGETPVVETPKPSEEVVIGGGAVETVPEQPKTDVPAPSETTIGDSSVTVPVEEKEKEKTPEEVIPTTPPETKEPEGSQLGDNSDKTPKEPEKSEVVTPDKPSEPEKKEDTPKPDKQPIVTEEVKEAEKNTGASSTGQAKPITQPELVAPVETNTGHVIVGTQNGDVVVQTAQGTTEIKKAESVGAVKQKDGTVAIKTKEGKLEVLPKTGDTKGLISLVIGILVFLGAGLYHQKDKVKQWVKSLKK